MRAEVLLACQGDLPAFFGIRLLARRYQRFCGMLMFDRTGGSSRLLKKSSQPASPSVVSPASGRELKEGSQFYRSVRKAFISK
jgi:hypothetical protein